MNMILYGLMVSQFQTDNKRNILNATLREVQKAL